MLSILTLLWSIASAWSPTGPDSWQLSASSPGTYTLEGCSPSPLPAFTISYRHKQNLSGSGNKNSSTFFVFTTPENSEFLTDTLSLWAGETGSTDPIHITSSSGSIDTIIHHPFFDFAAPFDLDFTLKFSADSSHLTLFAATHSTASTIHLADLPSNYTTFLCMGFSATCTSSNTEAFSFGLLDLTPTFTPVQPLYIVSDSVLSQE